MTITPQFIKSARMKGAMHTLAAQYANEDRGKDADAIAKAARDLPAESAARLYDILMGEAASREAGDGDTAHGSSWR